MIFLNPFARIIVGYDGSAPAESALDESLVLAQQYGGELVVVHSSDNSAPALVRLPTAVQARTPEPDPLLASLDRYRYDLYLKLSRRAGSSNVPISLEFSMNRAADGILDAVTRWQGTAIAIGTHARNSFARTVVGSVAEEIVRSALVPVIVTRAGVPTRPLHRIIVGVDDSEPSANVSSFAIRLACEHSVRSMYCCVIDTKRLVQTDADPAFEPQPLLARMRIEARNAIDSALQAASDADVYPDTEIIGATDIASGLCDAARRHVADAIVIGTHKRNTFVHLMLGSTAESILRHSDVPVIVVPADAMFAPTPVLTRVPARA